MIEVAICDDVERDAVELIHYIDDKIFEANCDVYENALKFLESKKEYDVIFVDCEMPDMSGEEMAEHLRERNVDSLLVFYTGAREPTPEVFRLRPFRYLLKDMTPEKLRREVEEIMEKCRERKIIHYVYAKNARDLIKLPVYTISYIELAKHGSIIHATQDGISREYTVKENIREMRSKLGDSGFAQPHNSYLVSMEHVASYQKTYIQMMDGIELNVSRAYRKKFESAFRRFMLGKR